MSVSFRLTVERIMFYAMVVIMIAVRFVPSAQCAGLACVLVALAFLYAVGSWWLLRRQGVWGFFQPFLIGWFGSLVPFLWGMRLAGWVDAGVPVMVMALAMCVATWIVAAWAQRKVDNGLTVLFVSVRMGLFILCGVLFMV